MTHPEFLAAFGQVVGVSADGITGDEILDDLDGWDSLAQMSFLAMVDEKLGVSLKPGDLAACRTVADLGRLVKPALSEA